MRVVARAFSVILCLLVINCAVHALVPDLAGDMVFLKRGDVVYCRSANAYGHVSHLGVWDVVYLEMPDGSVIATRKGDIRKIDRPGK